MFALLIFPGRPSIVLPSASVQWTLAGRKNLDLSIEAVMLALPIFPGRPTYCHAVRDSPVDCYRRKKNPQPKLWVLCWHYLSSRAVARQVLSAQTSLTSVFGMGTGGPSQQSIPT